MTDMSAKEWNEKGNENFEEGKWLDALDDYQNALDLEENDYDKGLYYTNRAAAHLKLGDYDKVIEDCDSALKLCYIRALYYKYQALTALDRLEEAYRVAETIISFDPNNEIIEPVATRDLRKVVQERREIKLKINAKASQLLAELALFTCDVNIQYEEKCISIMTELCTLARGDPGADDIFIKETIAKIAQLGKVKMNETIICSAIGIIGQLCKNNVSRTNCVIKSVGLPWFLEMINSTSRKRVKVSKDSLQNVLDAYIEHGQMSDQPDSILNKLSIFSVMHEKEISTIMLFLSFSVTRTLTGIARDAIIELITHNMNCIYYQSNIIKRFVALRGVQRLMEIASEKYECKHKSSMDITSSTQKLTSVCLSTIYENVYFDEKRLFVDAIQEFVNTKLDAADIESKVRIVVAITTLLLGPSYLGKRFVAVEEILEIILVMAETDDVLQQKVALECIDAAITSDLSGYQDAIINQVVNILKKLCQSQYDSVRVHALLVTFCDANNTIDPDATTRPFVARLNKELAEACRRLLTNSNEKEREWAIKGLIQITFNAEVKQELIKDKNAISAMFKIAKTGDKSVFFDVLTTLVNLCNADDEQESEQETTEFTNSVDEEERLEERLGLLVEAGVIPALVNFIHVLVNFRMANQNNSEELDNEDFEELHELIARIFRAICSKHKLREMVVQQGASEALLSLALMDGTDKGKKQSSLALVCLALMKRPEVIFPGQLITQIIRPIVNLLNLECSVNENWQTLTALCNLAEAFDSVREHIFKEEVFQKIEAFKYEEDHILSLAFANLINNLLLSREIAIEYFKKKESRVEYLMLLYNNENQDIKFAAAAALVKLTVANEEAGRKVFNFNNWVVFTRSLLTNLSPNIQEMGVIFVLSMIKTVEDIERLIKKNIIQLLRDTKILRSIALEVVAELFSEAALNVIRWERDTARRLGQLDLLHILEIKLCVYEHTKNVPLNVYEEFGRELTGQ